MQGYVGDIERLTLENEDFRRVIYTAGEQQLVLMAIPEGEEIGEEVHDKEDQFLRFEAGEGEVQIDGHKHKVTDGSAVIVPHGAKHNVINTGKEPLKLYTLYSPPHHKDGTVHKTKEEAEADEDEHFDGETTEDVKA
ncbi:MAG TPA: cupin domain-containing protein [Caulobacteraceae bacterium]|nr:cupin domain-containing protein [Caulobacteraceae bacterium]